MRKKNNYIKLIITHSLFFLLSCSTLKSYNKESFLKQFFNNETVYLSLYKYYGNNIVIYDEKKLITDKKLNFKIDSTKINVEILEPTGINFLRVHDFIIDKNLGFVVLSTYNRNRGIIYYLKKNPENKRWSIMDVKEKNAR